jgi:GT2 family glycosyltransferase
MKISNTPSQRSAQQQPAEPGLPVVSVVFLAYNRRDALHESLRRMVAESGYPAERLEVIAVDNASTDDTATMVEQEHPEVRLVRNERNVGAPGWNAGFRLARGDYVLILDDDAYLPPGGLEQAVLAAQAEEADLVSFAVVSAFAEDHRLNDDWRTGLLSYWGCAALVSRRALDALGGYDPHMFIWANELEFTMRLLDGGFGHLFLPDVRAVHMKEPILEFEPQRYRVNARHHAYVAGKLMRPVDALVIVRNLLVNAVIDAAVEDRSTLATIPLVIRGFLEGLRRRQPAREVVSAVYRENFRPFAGSWRFLRGPTERWRSLCGEASAEQQRTLRQERYFAERPRFHPHGRASLRL